MAAQKSFPKPAIRKEQTQEPPVEIADDGNLWTNLGLAALWIYVAALWALAISQTFNLGWFGP